jgi:hypothetical protein
MPLTSLVTDQLAAVGLPMRYTSQISTLFQGDIVRLGVRLALIGLLASLIRGHYDRLKNWANLSEWMRKVLNICSQARTLPYCTSYR